MNVRTPSTKTHRYDESSSSCSRVTRSTARAAALGKSGRALRYEHLIDAREEYNAHQKFLAKEKQNKADDKAALAATEGASRLKVAQDRAAREAATRRVVKYTLKVVFVVLLFAYNVRASFKYQAFSPDALVIIHVITAAAIGYYIFNGTRG